jgi:type IV secretory pathway TrbD component
MPFVLMIISLVGFGLTFQTPTWLATLACVVCLAGFGLSLWAMAHHVAHHVREEDVDLPPGPATTRAALADREQV